MDEQDQRDYEEMMAELAEEEGTPHAAQRHHRELMMDEDGEHYYNQSWEQCPGCQNDNPHFDGAGGRRL
jgi:hypothetical protein